MNNETRMIDSPILSRDMINAVSDEDTLQHWMLNSGEAADDIKIQIEAWNFAEMDQEDEWFRRAVSALTAQRMQQSWCKKRLLELGYSPKHPPSDPLALKLRQSAEYNELLRKELKKFDPQNPLVLSYKERLLQAA